MNMFYALKQRLALLLKVYSKQLLQEKDNESVNNYSKVIESVIVKITEIRRGNASFKQLMLCLLVVAIICENVMPNLQSR